MKLILHTWVALFYRKPGKLLSSSRKVVEHINPKKFVSINSSGAFPELSDDGRDCFGWRRAGKENARAFPADSQTDADGVPGAVDSTVSSSSGELLRGGEEEEEEEEEEEPSSTSCPESFSRPEPSGEKRDAGGGDAGGAALLKARGFVGTDPREFRGSQRLLVVVRNEDISSHIHTVPCLLELKRCPSVVFAGVDDPEEVTADTFQELFQAGGFVVSDEELLERVTLGQLKEVVKVLEELNRGGRWKWLLHHRESKKLRGDLRDDASAQRKRLLLRWCQGEELLEPLPFHACDAAAGARRLPCLLELQARRVHARFAVFLTENPDSGSRELLESKGILVADVSTFLGTVQELAAPFRRSYW
ncbi:hypothetical protein DUI87_33297 [Hirundo rustica rustica]|uniref:Uncharacterized protein n=1 Tax=Hirundo rustica rustica TaxID=333673 RepID=A0A3M0INC3_HIRRU|nr:hypothetical protein DUI87_33297 [Hirundo rustica rustica]